MDMAFKAEGVGLQIQAASGGVSGLAPVAPVDLFPGRTLADIGVAE